MEELIKEILNKENIEFNKLRKATSGFTNFVYFIDDKFVIKMSNNDKLKEKIEKEISIYNNIKLHFIPKMIGYGNWKDFKYLIITEVKGESLYSIWHTLKREERKNCVNQIAQILKSFNNQDYSFLNDKYKIFDWCDFMKKEIDEKLNLLDDMGYDIQSIKTFVTNNFDKLFANNNFKLVYNDAHFDNFIYDNGKLSLIDFDRVIVSPIEYEMLIFKTMCDNPAKFASEQDEVNVKDCDYDEVFEQFKNAYPEMFDVCEFDKRIKFYQFNYLIEHAITSKNNTWTKNLIEDLKRFLGI